MRQLPLFNDLWAQSLARDDFTIISVTLDGRDTMPKLRSLLAEHRIKFPVLHYLDGDKSGNFGWDIAYLPKDILIDPQGVIVEDIWAREDFFEMLDFFKQPPGSYPRLGLQVCEQVNADMSVTANITISSSDHKPLELELGAWREYFDDDGGLDHVMWDGEESLTKLIEFEEFGEYSFTLEFPAAENIERFYLWASMELPGGESFYDGDGFSIIADCNLYFDEEGLLRVFD